MKFKQVPLALALALAIGTLAAGCAQDDQPAADATADTADTAVIDAHANAAADQHATEDHASDAHDAAVAAAGGTDFPVPENHAQWTPDAPLMEGMSRVRTALAGLEAESHADDATVVARAADIDAAVEYMFANCQLPTEPDIALHAILARLMANTQALKANPSDGSPVADMHAAVHNYEQLFDDPGEADAGSH